jgi:hypothetical protein
MQTSSVVNRHFRQAMTGDARVGVARTRHSKFRVWRRSENVVAAFSLAVLVTTVLVLIYQAIVY